MKKYRFIKDFGDISATSLYNEEGRYIGDISKDKIDDGEVNKLMQGLIPYKNFFKDCIEEYIEPKFKVGDYAVYEGENIEYIKIYNIKKSGMDFVYNSTPTADGFSICYYEANLRSPTQEELEKYFR